MKRLLLLAALAFAAPSFAQTRVTPCDPATPNDSICVFWAAPTTNTDGTPATLAFTYRVERLQQVTNPSWMAVETTSALRSYVRNLAPGTYTFRVFAIAGGKESASSNAAGRTVDAPTPNPPVIQVVRVIIGVDHAPVYRVLSSGARSNVLIGLATVGAPCEGPALFSHLGRTYRKPAAYQPHERYQNETRAAAPCS